MIKEEVIRKAFETVDKKIRSASLAEIGGFKPPAEPSTSWFGGNFVLPIDEKWPSNDNGPMIPLLQILVAELPHVPAPLSGSALVQIFIDRNKLPVGSPSANGNGWMIRLYAEAIGFQRRPTPIEADLLHPFPVRWKPSVNEAPTWDDAWSDCNNDEFIFLLDSVDLFHQRYHNHPYTKVGGWPSWIQGISDRCGDFILQISSEEKPRWMVGDNGNIYIFHDAGHWFLTWDCY